MADKPIVARFATGEEYGYESEADVPAEAEIVRYQDGTSLERQAEKKTKAHSTEGASTSDNE